MTGEGQLYPVDADSFTSIPPYDSFKIASLCKLSLQFVNDTKFDLDSYLMREFARRFARAEEKVLLTGTGIEEPLGLLNSADSISSTEAGKLRFDDVVTLYFSLEPEYRKHAVWVMGDETAFSLRMEKDQSGYPPLAGRSQYPLWKTCGHQPPLHACHIKRSKAHPLR